MASYAELQELIVTGQEDKVSPTVQSLLNSGKAPMDIISDGLIAGMDVVGVKFKSGDMFIPEVMASAHAMKEGMDLLKPLISGETSFSMGKAIFGTVEGDIHSIGKSIVAMLMESSGFEIIDLGVDVPVTKFVDVVKKEQPRILGMSALLTTTMPRMKDVIEALKEAGFRDNTRVMVGGAPLTQEFADSIGADGYAPDASSAVDKAKAIIG